MNYVILAHPISYALDDPNNYNYILPASAGDCFKIYTEIMHIYITHFFTSKYVNTLEKVLFYYLLEKGIDTINHIFKIMLLYTKNLDLTNYYCKQTVEYYVEFIEQNMQHADGHKIDYNNASKFSYSKTIYKLKKRCRKTSYNELDDQTSELLYMVEEKEANIFKIVELMLELYKKMAALHFNTLQLQSQAIGEHILLLVTDEPAPGEKLQFILDFINRFIPPEQIGLKYIYSLCQTLKYTVPFQTTTVIKKLASDENKIRFQQANGDAGPDVYIKWLFL